MPFSDYTKDSRSTSGRTSVISHSEYDNRTPGFAADLCVYNGDVTSNDFSNISSTCSLLIDATNQEVIYSVNAFDRRFPASITKLMTAYVALKYMTPESIITCKDAVTSIDNQGAVLLGLNRGDYFTLDQALHLCLLSSYNDVAMAIAENVSGTVDDFVELMNSEARALGCTNTHFTDPTGLGSPDHYTTGYDLYLIFNAVIQDPFLLEVMQCNEYSTLIHSVSGGEREVSSKNTNQYFVGNYQSPASIKIIGGKTGTTTEAGHCLIVLTRDINSKPYIALVMGADSRDDLYTEMTNLLSLCELK